VAVDMLMDLGIENLFICHLWPELCERLLEPKKNPDGAY